jgi:hypothetical protein
MQGQLSKNAWNSLVNINSKRKVQIKKWLKLVLELRISRNIKRKNQFLKMFIKEYEHLKVKWGNKTLYVLLFLKGQSSWTFYFDIIIWYKQVEKLFILKTTPFHTVTQFSKVSRWKNHVPVFYPRDECFSGVWIMLVPKHRGRWFIWMHLV